MKLIWEIWVNTYAYGISGNTEVGFYTTSSTGPSYGYIYNGSTYQSLNVPGSVQTRAYGISGNNIVGMYQGGSTLYGFLYNGFSFLQLAVPGATATFATGISGNNVLGYYEENGDYYGYLYNNGNYTTISVPNATSTITWGIENDTIVGSYYVGSSPTVGLEIVPSPEPSTLAIIGTSAGMIWFLRREKRLFYRRKSRDGGRK